MLNDSLIVVEYWPELVARLGLAALIGMALGFDREYRDHPAGIRTHGILALSAALITTSALLLFEQLGGSEARLDPLRVVEGMATAAGIIGAGLIVFKGGDIKNLTTAAHLWLTAAIGIACGAGQYVLVAIAAVLGLFMLVVVRRLEISEKEQD